MNPIEFGEPVELGEDALALVCGGQGFGIDPNGDPKP